MSKKKKIILFSLGIFFLALIIATGIYLGIYYKADDSAVSSFLSQGRVQPKEIDNNLIAFEPENPVAGLIFYQGGKVDSEAYYPLMQACADKGILCVVVKMPFKLAIFGKNRANKVPEHYPEIESWYIGGHSLGGAMAASYANKHTDKLSGVVLLAAYSTKDLSNTDLKVLSIYGSCDKVLNMDKYNSNKDNLPSDFTEEIIDGGNHAYFGMYGEQKGDGEATVLPSEQIYKAAEIIVSFIK